jgi:hypothetical protein
MWATRSVVQAQRHQIPKTSGRNKKKEEGHDYPRLVINSSWIFRTRAMVNLLALLITRPSSFATIIGQ